MKAIRFFTRKLGSVFTKNFLVSYSFHWNPVDLHSNWFRSQTIAPIKSAPELTGRLIRFPQRLDWHEDSISNERMILRRVIFRKDILVQSWPSWPTSESAADWSFACSWTGKCPRGIWTRWTAGKQRNKETSFGYSSAWRSASTFCSYLRQIPRAFGRPSCFLSFWTCWVHLIWLRKPVEGHAQAMHRVWKKIEFRFKLFERLIRSID